MRAHPVAPTPAAPAPPASAAIPLGEARERFAEAAEVTSGALIKADRDPVVVPAPASMSPKRRGR